MLMNKAIRAVIVFFCFLVLGELKSQNTVMIGDPNSTTISERYPFNDFYNYSWSNVVYLQSEIGQGGQITKIAFNVYNNPGLTMANQIIYMRHTTATSYTTGTYPGTTGFTQVFNGSITYSSAGWKEITLTTPFTYNGTDNLEFLFEDHNGSWSNNFPYFYVTSGYSVNRSRRDFEDATFPTSCYNCAAVTNIPNIKITIGCATTMSVTPSSASICTGNSTTLTASGVTSYTWVPGTGLNTTTSASVTASPTVTTTYTVTGKDGANCTQTKTVTVTVNPLPTLTISPSSATICNGSSQTFIASGASTYTWSPTTGLNVTTGSTVTASPTTTITYTVTGTNSNLCVNTNTVTLTVNPVNSITITPSSSSICTGSSTSLVASGAQSYTWAPSTGLNTTTSATVTANPTVTTTYTVTGNCSQTKTITVTVNSLPTLTVTPSSASICNGNSTNLTVSGASTYTWSPTTGLNTSTGASVTASPTATITYTVTGTDANGCVNTKTDVVTVNSGPTLTITPSSATICNGSSTTLTASGAGTYTWSPNSGLNTTTSATVVASPTTTTTYSISATAANGCVGNTTAVVTVNANPSVSVSPTSTTVCNGGSVTLTASGAATYTWSPATALNTTSGSSVITTPTGAITYTVTGTASGCTGTATASISVANVNAGTAVASGGTVNCNNGQVSLSLDSKKITTIGTGTVTTSNYPFNGFYNYSWSDVIYLQSELGAAGSITKLGFYVDNAPSNYIMNNQQIYIRTTSLSGFSDGTYPTTTGFTQVFSGTITYNGSGWQQITLSTPFTYDGTSNLEILYENHDASWASGFPNFRYTSGYSSNRTKRDYNDASFPSSCVNCAAVANVLNTQFTIDRTLGTFVKWQSSTDNINYTDITGGTTQNYTANINTSSYFRAQVTDGSCPAVYSDPVFYVTNNNYYVNDNSTTGDVFTSAVGSGSNDGKSPSRPKASINDVFATYTLGPCDTIFVDKGTYTEEVDMFFGDGGNSSGNTTIHGAGIDVSVLNAPTNKYNMYFGQPDYIKVEGFTMNSTQTSYPNISMVEAENNIIAGNKFTHSGTTNIQIFGDNLDANYNQVINNTISNSSAGGNGILIWGNCDNLTVSTNTITMSNASSQDAILVATYSVSSNVYYPSGGIITQNTISAYSYGVSLYGYDYPISTYTVSNNTITMQTKTIADGAPVWLGGVGSSSSDQTIINNNRLIGGKNGVYFAFSADYTKIYNNYISNNDYGLYVASATSDIGELYFNSFYNQITNLFFTSSSDGYWKVKDNILYTTNSTNTNANISVGSNVTFVACDYNLFYAPNGASIGRFNGTNYSSLSSWQNIDHADETTKGDEHSINGNPNYTNVTTNVLDIPGNSAGAYKGVSLTGITSDIFGLNRTSTPSIGADEPNEASSAFFFRSIQSGNWNQLSTWQASPDSVNWIAANITPSSTEKSIYIQSGHTVTITSSVTIDEVVVNGTLVLANNAGNDLTISNGKQADFVINGTFQDNSPDNIIWTSNASWSLGASGTLQISSDNTGNGWKDNYQGGISTIPSTANWVLNKTGTMNPYLISSSDMVYPNLIIQNNSGASWTTGTGSVFSGTATAPTIKGNFDIGGTGANPVVFVNQNTNATPVLVQGNLTVESGSTLQNNGTGFNVQGNLNVIGSFTGTKNLFFSGNNTQTYSGASISEINNLNLNKSGGQLTLNEAVTIDNTLTLTSGFIISTATNILTINNGASVSGASTSSFIKGPVKKIGNSAFTFPTGKGTNYQPITISAPAAPTDAFTGEYFNSAQSFGTNSDSTIGVTGACEYWNLTPAAGTSSVSVTAGWNSSSCFIDSIQNMRMAYWDGSMWKDVGGTNATGNRSAGAVTSGSAFRAIGGWIVIGPFCFGTASITSSNGLSFCQGSSTILTAHPPTGLFWSLSPSYLWTNSNNSSTASTNTLSVNTTGNYSVTVTGIWGCKAKTSKHITVNPTPNVSVSPTTTTICSGENVSLTVSGANTYTWSPATGLSSTTGNNVTANPTSNTIYTVTGTDVNGCTAKASVTVNVNSPPTISVNPTSTVMCNGSSVALTASGGSTYTWSPATGLSSTNGSNVTANPSSSQVYTVNATDVNGCVGLATTTVTVNSNPTIVVNSPAVCLGTLANLSASGAVTYTWTPATGLSSVNGANVTANVSSNQSYVVMGTDANGCTGSATSVVTVNSLPVVSVAPTTTAICCGNGATLVASGASTYAWLPTTGLNVSSGASVIATPSASQIYTVTGTDANGCTGTATSTVTVNASNSYAVLKRMLDGGYYQIQNSKLYFTLDGEYNNGNLKYKIYDYKRATRPSTAPPTQSLTYGDNRYFIDLTTIGFSSTDNGSYFTLEVMNEKNEMFFLKFRY
jgi:hypothetical protein